ncbi:MAG: Rha family transcriptional regulator [Selenomonadaceae bacterium]|nr:Rha family transcriptional regulator [Selenomonadaceae bacterium]
MSNLVEVRNQQVVASSKQVAEHFGKRHDKLFFEIGRMYGELVADKEGVAQNGGHPMFYLNEYVHPQNKQTYQEYLMNRDGFSLLVMGFTGKKALEWKLKYIEAFNAMEKQLREQTKPKTQLDILVESAKALQEQERRLARTELDIEDIKKQQQIQSSRIDTFNCVCTEGTKRQKLVSMIQAYAAKKGLTYREGWHRFKAAYNTAFHTSIGNSISYYVKENGLKKKPSVPEFLEKKGLLDDAMRIADKLLNGEIAAVGA